MQYFPALSVLYLNQNINAMYETMILTIDVSTFSDGRKLAEHLENQKYDSFGELTKAIDEELGDESDERDDYNIQIWTLTDFMDACNNEEIFLDDLWIGYVQLKKA